MLAGKIGLVCYGVYLFLIFLEGLIKFKSLPVALLSPVVTLIQMFGYGYGLVYEWIRKVAGKDPNTKYIELYEGRI